MSTFTSYLTLSRDLPLTLKNLASTREVANAAQYYQANIGKVKTVDDLMKDQRLYAYAMKAAGLEDMAYAKAFIKKVLMSDLSDTESFANKLTDKRYLALAQSFNFDASGKVNSFTDIQSDLQEKDMIGLYNSSILAREDTSEKAIADYSAGINAITSVDDLLAPANKKVFDFAMTAYGLADMARVAYAPFFRSILTGDPTDPDGPLNQVENVALRTKLYNFVTSFNFQADGSLPSGESAQLLTQKSATIVGYLQNSGTSTVSATLQTAAQTYRDTIGTITSADDLVAKSSVYNFVLTAFGLDPSKVNSADVLAALKSDLSDPASAANTLGLGYQRMAQAFNFEADGSITPGQPVQTADAVESTVTKYLANANGPGLPSVSEYKTYSLTINKAGLVTDVDDLLDILQGVSPESPANPNAVTDATAEVMRDFVFQSLGFQLPVRYSRDFLRNVLTDQSFADAQDDKRWSKLGSLFNVNADGSIPGGGPVQDQAKVEEMLARYVGSGFGGAHISQQATNAYHFDMQLVRNVDDFLNDKSSFSFALVAFGFDKDKASKDFFRQVLTDPAFAAAQTDPRYAEFKAAFNFAADGSLAVGQSAQSQPAEDRMIERFLSQTTTGSGAYNSRLTDEYKTKIATIRTVTDLMKDANNDVYQFALKAFGIDPAQTTKADIAKVLTSNLADTKSFANTLGGNFLDLAKAFNFGASGIVPTAQDTQSATQLTTTVNNYLSRQNVAALAQTTGASDAFKSSINNIESRATVLGTKPVDEFLGDASLFNYALIAFGLDPKTESKDTVRKALISDKASAFSFVNQPGNEKYLALANALNFDPDGTVGTPRQAQNASDALRLATKYAASYPTSTRPAYAPDTPTAQETLIKAESDYYSSAILKVRNVDELVTDKRLTDYILKAFGYDQDKFSRTDLKKILTSDLADPKSFANTSKDLRYRELAATFNFDTSGQTKRLPEQAVQSSGGVYQVHSDYLQQTLETNAGNDNQGVRLALYFKRKASTITSSYSILADKALLEVVRTALQIPQQALAADLDVLSRTIDKKFNVADLIDPVKLDNFIKRFTALYDMENGGGVSTTNNALSLLTGDAGGVSQDLLLGLQTVRFRAF